MRLESILDQMQKDSERLGLYQKKKKTMGLDKVEESKYFEILADYLKCKTYLFDNVFDMHILPKIMTKGLACSIYQEIYRKLGWQCELLVEEKKMEVVKERYDQLSDKEGMKNKLIDLYIELSVNLREVLADKNNREFLSEISILLNDGVNPNLRCLEHHLQCKFESIYIAIGGSKSEEIDEES